MNSVQAYTLMHKGILALERAERAGIRVDVEYLKVTFKELTDEMDRLDTDFKNSKFYSDWAKSQDKEPNLNSSMQLSNFLYTVKKRKPPKLTGTGRGSTDKESLLALNIPELNMILESKKLKKIRDYIEGFDREQVDGWLHPSFNLHLVRTFRSSSDRPNFQNIPKRDKQAMRITRSALYPRHGHQLLEVDYGALEVRIAACYHKDPTMLKYIKTGYDMHADMAQQLFKFKHFDKHKKELGYLRSATKNGFVFPQFYGDYFRNCAEAMACTWGELPKTGKWKPGQGVPVEAGKSLSDHFISVDIKDLAAFTNHVEAVEKEFWGKRFKIYAQWKEKHWHEYQKNGYVDLLTGFRCKGLMGKNDAINYPIQGAAFHCLLWSLIKLDELIIKYGLRSRIIGQIHDAIVFDVYPPELDELIKLVRDVTTVMLPKAWDWINVPLDVDFEICDVDASWADKKELET
jgi:DNA polymerase-1